MPSGLKIDEWNNLQIFLCLQGEIFYHFLPRTHPCLLHLINKSPVIEKCIRRTSMTLLDEEKTRVRDLLQQIFLSSFHPHYMIIRGSFIQKLFMML